ncbi:MAG: S8 family serine peptidase [Acidimicrobiales bacterium]
MTFESTITGPTAVRPAAGDSLHRQGLSGLGVGIAIIDSGVTAATEFGRRLVTGPDFTVDAGTIDETRDHTGHGTHLAGIAAGDNVGVAPGSHVVSLKAASAGGATDVDAVIAAIDWTIAHRHELSIGVLLLAFGADQLPRRRFDPLADAVARAWRAGIVVVTSAGNGGQDGPLSTPAHIDEVITVAGAEQVAGRWIVSDFSDRGVAGCRPDLAAPGRSLIGPIAPGSDSEQAPASSVVADGFVKGTGTSQAAAVVAGAAALLLEADSSLTPDEVKHVLSVSAARMDDDAAGAGALDLDVALAFIASGLLRIESTPAAELTGTPAGLEWTGFEWSGVSWRGVSWRGVSWRGLEWSGVSWRGVSWR